MIEILRWTHQDIVQSTEYELIVNLRLVEYVQYIVSGDIVLF